MPGRHIATVLMTVALAAAARPAPASAQAAPVLPSVTVPTFAPTSGGLSLEERRALADDLAARLVDTTRFRVMAREWLPLPSTETEPAPVATLRRAAASADVDFIVQGWTTSVARRSFGPARRFGPLPVSVRPFTAPRQALFSRGALSISVRVLDVASGATVRSSVAGGDGSSLDAALNDIAHTLNLAGISGDRHR